MITFLRVFQTKRKSKIPGERFFLDIRPVKTRSFGGSKFWLLLIDDATGFKFSYFLKKNLNAALNYEVNFIHCDNAIENLKLEEKSKKEGLGVVSENTAPNTPQQNGKVERALATLYGRVGSMLNSVILNKEFRRGLWAKCAIITCD
mmetsp:Transcript_2486/g.3443  ORF Transcript_2486/g.3443 Transcript_2486/m.3443 type:complete len:147 (-) Transcript_2486:1212-1652(-)